ncbi:ABC-type transport auxiliary lipoprotein family protein [Erythrobacter sp. T5W1-R]|uniref:ABC-type transport auxiliary lipoprotein family protein n=1 Tax=Erythrobacter sp. T5W1-R TaxID=3101752 RepID=UPI002AFE4090|nr:ABC-type transport auxiliary lipoprotein family protein [Erythrobacter sp. T5W1-R]MEA1618230.1 ABC-type transport auxiliary lipoprotein family protein [Erythrobacter sp. T5W1-R]
MKDDPAMRQSLAITAHKQGRALKHAAAALVLAALAGCVSLGGGKPPESLLTLSPLAAPAAGSGAEAGRDTTGRAILVQLPDTPAKLDVLRLPVAVTDTEIAYLEETYWVEKPARLFRRLVGETVRARGAALVIDNDDTPLLADVTLRGTLLDMGYDARDASVVVRFDAVRTEAGDKATSRRFEARESGVAPEARAVGPALNRAANQVAADVAEWLAQ